jgi:NAD(P)-dependent dehydrogenase (short-subunit alcohol dehydrogenase family)
MSDSTMQVDLQGKVAVVTGGGGVLCSMIARGLARAGAAVALMNRRAETSEAVAEAIRRGGGEAFATSADVLDNASLERARDAVLERFGGMDILVNGAGGNQPGATTEVERASAEDVAGARRTFFDLDPQAFQAVLDVNLMGTVRATQIFGAEIGRRRDGGSVVNVSSMSAFVPLTKVAGYSAAKAAVNNFTMWLAVHLAPLKVRVNAIAPGFFLTEQNRFLLTDEKSGELTARGETIIEHTPLRRFGNPEDLLGAVLYLVSDAASFTTGTVLPVDGGFAAFSGV